MSSFLTNLIGGLFKRTSPRAPARRPHRAALGVMPLEERTVLSTLNHGVSVLAWARVDGSSEQMNLSNSVHTEGDVPRMGRPTISATPIPPIPSSTTPDNSTYGTAFFHLLPGDAGRADSLTVETPQTSILVGMLLPAVQKVREASSRSASEVQNWYGTHVAGTVGGSQQGIDYTHRDLYLNIWIN